MVLRGQVGNSMFKGFTLAIAHLKVGLKGRKNYIGLYPNKLVYRVLEKLRQHNLIIGYGLYRPRVNFVSNTKTNVPNKITTLRRRKFLISVFLRYDNLFESIIRDIKCVSTSGHRVYFNYNDVLRAYAQGDEFLLSTTSFGLIFISEIVTFGYKTGGEVLLKILY